MRSYQAAQRRAGAASEHDRRFAMRQMEQRRRHLEDLRMKALAEQAKGAPGVWTAEYEAEIAADQAAAEAAARADQDRAAEAARSSQGCLVVALSMVGLFVLMLFGACAISTCSTCANSYELNTGADHPAPVKTNRPARGKK